MMERGDSCPSGERFDVRRRYVWVTQYKCIYLLRNEEQRHVDGLLARRYIYGSLRHTELKIWSLLLSIKKTIFLATIHRSLTVKLCRCRHNSRFIHRFVLNETVDSMGKSFRLTTFFPNVHSFLNQSPIHALSLIYAEQSRDNLYKSGLKTFVV